MVSLKWGEVLSTLLPGALALFGLACFFPAMDAKVHNIDQIGVPFGVVLLMASALCGGLLEAFTRVTWEKWCLVALCKPPAVLHMLTKDNLELYERGVQSSYKYVTFYANFAWATMLLIASRFCAGHGVRSGINWVLALVIGVLLYASYVQWTYYVNYLNKVFVKGVSDAREERGEQC
jgi:drug/metabolite transporter (DMT)-like permease